MENIGVTATHRGAIEHIHSFTFNRSVVDALKEVRLGVSVIVLGWIAVTSVQALRSVFARERKE